MVSRCTIAQHFQGLKVLSNCRLYNDNPQGSGDNYLGIYYFNGTIASYFTSFFPDWLGLLEREKGIVPLVRWVMRSTVK